MRRVMSGARGVRSDEAGERAEAQGRGDRRSLSERSQPRALTAPSGITCLPRTHAATLRM